MEKEVNRLLKKIQAEKLKKNFKECIELYNIVGGLYSEVSSYEAAINYHEEALDLCKTIGDRLGTAMALRYIGEAKAATGQFHQAIRYVKRYLEMAKSLNNKVEEQRAWTTLGRVYLMHAQAMKDENKNVIDNKIKETALQAESKFQTALNLAQSVSDQVDDKEFAQMKSGLLINIGLVKDICGQYGEAVPKLNQAVDLCRNAKLKEDLYRCLIILSGIHRQKNNIKMAAKISEEALVTAKQIGKKCLICEAYIEMGVVKICLRDFKGAKRAFAQAYLEKSPIEEDHTKAVRLTKLSHLIAENHEKLSVDSISKEERLNICDKLGDLFVAIESYKLAVEFYKRAYLEAQSLSKPKKELARILYSMAETYADDGQYEHAMVCYEKELKYRNGNDGEQCQTLIKIAHMHEYLDHELEDVSQAYEKALEIAGRSSTLSYNVLKDYVAYLERKSFGSTRCKKLQDKLKNLESSEEVAEEMEVGDEEDGEEEADDLENEIAHIDDIITDDEGNDEVLMVGRRRTKGPKNFKSNEVGETPLHEACIRGDFKRVKSLLSQGHNVNPRDHFGWTPLHEACNHGHYEIVDYLIESGADVSNRGPQGMSPLHDAATNGHYEIMRLLIKNGANVIALTDTGETVLNCLRDYKNRNFDDMSDAAYSEYLQMEAELLNVMDKCGFNLMDANLKNLKTKNTSSASALEEIRLKPRDNLSTVHQVAASNPVQDYTKTISALKRRRINEEPKEATKKANLPVIYSTDLNPSVATKEWLIDDVSKEKRIMQRRSNLLEFSESDDGDSSDDCVELNCVNLPPSLPDEDSRLTNTPHEFVKRELARIDQMGNKLDLAFTRFPRDHVKPLALALAKRDFTCVNLTGSFSLFDAQDNGREIINSIGVWTKLSQLNLKCVGLMRSHFETICRTKFPELKSLDVSVNAIAYKRKVEFRRQVGSLIQTSPKLKRLDIRRNHLEFVQSNPDQQQSADMNLWTMLEITIGSTSRQSFDEVMEILGANQREYSVYLA